MNCIAEAKYEHKQNNVLMGYASRGENLTLFLKT